MILYLRSVSSDEIFFGVCFHKKQYFQVYKISIAERAKFLIFLDTFLHSQGAMFSSLCGIVVLTSQGSLQGFSQMRMMVTIANTCAMGLQIPLWGVSEEEWNILWNKISIKPSMKPKRFVFPLYNKEPNITR